MNAWGQQHAEYAEIEEAQEWLRRFAPLVAEDFAATPSELGERLLAIQGLRMTGPTLISKLRSSPHSDSAQLLITVERAAAQLDSIEADMRNQSDSLRGIRSSTLDIETLNEKLSEREARQELGLETEEIPTILKLETGTGSWASAGFMFLFGLAWTSFTLVHNFFMLKGASTFLGWGVLGLMLFYLLFYAVGFGMLIGALFAAANESIEVEGRRLTIWRSLFGFKKAFRYQLEPGSLATIDNRYARSRNSDSPPTPAIIFTRTKGSPIPVGQNLTEDSRRRLLDQINAYLRVH